jgi:hypothetical protein
MADSPQGAHVPGDDLVYQFDFQPRWLDLTLEDVGLAEAWAVATVAAMTQFDSAQLTVKHRPLIRSLRRCALDLNRGGTNLAAAYYTPEGRFLADFRLDTYGEDEEPRPAPTEVVPLLLKSFEPEAIGEPDVQYLNLPVGPAVRIRADGRENRRLLFGRRRAAGLIKYAMFPPGMNDLSVVSVRWWTGQEADEGTCMTDELVPTARLVRADAEEPEAGPEAGD